MAYANHADPDQTAPEGAVWSESTLFAIPPNILRNNYIKNKFSPKIWNKIIKFLGQLPYFKANT